MEIKELINKYDISAPRYTSYPALPHWNKLATESTWHDSIRKNSHKNGIDLYIHIPFCKKLCYYCGCNRIITKNEKQAVEYVDALIEEWSFYKNKHKNLKIKMLHMGGGTPTFLTVNLIDKLLRELSSSFTQDFKGSIEVDPRVTSNEQLKLLAKYNFKRVSLGVQDFDKAVQKAVNRPQTVELVQRVVEQARKTGFESINFDLIHGLPLQTKETILKSIEEVIKLSPSMIAFYSYAHLPEKISNQRLIDKNTIPSGKEKRELYEVGKKCLQDHDMVEIGLDHFAQKDNYLAIAKKEKRLQRNFMGHTDEKGTLLIGLGVSSISSSVDHYVQNPKNIKEYYKMIKLKKHQFITGHILNDNEVIIAEIIQQLMCQERIEKKLLNDSQISPKKLDEFIEDNILKEELDEYQVTETGRMFLRNIASSIDPHFTKDSHTFSRTI